MTSGGLAARSIGSPVAGLLSRPGSGRVIATFDRSCYLDVSGQIAAVVAPELLNGPLNVVLANLPPETMRSVSTSQSVRLSSGSLEIDNTLTVDLNRAEIWNAHLLPLTSVDPHALQERLDVVKSVLESAPKESLAHVLSRPARASEGMDAMYSGLRHQDWPTLGYAAERLVGLGMGLTPSGDDVLAGMLIALHLVRPAVTKPVGDIVT